MKLASFAAGPGQAKRVGALLESSADEFLVDLAAAYAAHLWDRGHSLDAADIARSRVPGDMRELIVAGEGGFEVPQLALEHVRLLMERGDSMDELQQHGLLFRTAAIHFLPVVPRPGKIICAGVNYRSHAAEAAEAGVMDKPQHPVGFAKFPSVLTGHEAAIEYPSSTRQLDYEGELAIVIGRPAHNLSRDEALGAVAGYTIFNDISPRDIQFDEMDKGMLLLGKNLDGCGPMGPYLVTCDEVPDPHSLKLTTRVNGEIRQEASTADLIFGCDELIEYWSQVTLEPGDVIATGTPGGVGIFMDPPERYLLKRGDVVEVEIDRLGVLRNQIVASMTQSTK